MTDNPGSATAGRTWRFSPAFWIANGVELLERGAWYGVFIAITLYLSRILGFDDIQAGVISGLFSAGLYLLPPFSGAHRRSHRLPPGAAAGVRPADRSATR